MLQEHFSSKQTNSSLVQTRFTNVYQVSLEQRKCLKQKIIKEAMVKKALIAIYTLYV